MQKVGSQQAPIGTQVQEARVKSRALGSGKWNAKTTRQGLCHIAWVSIAEPRGRLWLRELEGDLSVLLFMVHILSFRQQTES